MDVEYTGNELRALCKIAKKYKMACPIADKLMVTPDCVQYIINPKMWDTFGIAVDAKQLASIVKPIKETVTVDVDVSSVSVNGFRIPTVKPFTKATYDNTQKIYKKIIDKLEMDGSEIRLDNQITISVEQLKAFCGTLDKEEGIKIELHGQSVKFTGMWHETTFTVDLPYRQEGSSDISCCMGNEYVSKWLSLASANSMANIRIEQDHPMLISIKINGCWFDTIIAPRLENE